MPPGGGAQLAAAVIFPHMRYIGKRPLCVPIPTSISLRSFVAHQPPVVALSVRAMLAQRSSTSYTAQKVQQDRMRGAGRVSAPPLLAATATPPNHPACRRRAADLHAPTDRCPPPPSLPAPRRRRRPLPTAC